jgi:SPP1 family phage portal protein
VLSTDEILQFIQEDTLSEKKSRAAEGLRYYEGDHDIKRYKLFYYDADGQLVEDKTRSNIKISHAFFTELVDQEVQYMLSGKNSFVKSDISELQGKLDEYFNYNEDFISELYETITGCVAKGFEYMYAFKNSENKLAFQCADSMGVIEVESKFTNDGKDYVIYWYTERINKDRERVKRIQVWDDSQTYFFTQIEDGKLVFDESSKDRPNPRPHVLYKKDHDDSTYYEGLGFIPFFRLDNCRKQFGGLKPIKTLIDDYDLMSCGLSNNLQDASEYLVVVKGFQGDNLEELIKNIKTKKHIGVDGENGGGVDFKTVDIPYEARKVKLELDEKNIYRFGMGFNSAQTGDGNLTNIVIKSRYALLDLKCNKLEIRLKQFLRRLLKVVLKEINDSNGTDYRQADVYFDFEREVMTNAQDNAQIELTDAQTQQAKINTLLSLQAALGDDLVIQNICEVLDLDYEKIKSKLPINEERLLATEKSVLSEVVTDE